jgi:hypothetical protein
MRRPAVLPALFVLGCLLDAPAGAFQADLVPIGPRAEASEIEGAVSIGGEGGTIRVQIENVNDAQGEPLDSDRMTVRVKVRVNGQRRRVTLPLTVDAGDGEATTSLGLSAGSPVAVYEVRVRNPNGRTLAVAGVLTAAVVVPPPEPPPPPDQCPAALASCQDDLTFCNEELDACESGL